MGLIQEQVNWHPGDGWKKAVSSESPRVRQNICFISESETGKTEGFGRTSRGKVGGS